MYNEERRDYSQVIHALLTLSTWAILGLRAPVSLLLCQASQVATNADSFATLRSASTLREGRKPFLTSLRMESKPVIHNASTTAACSLCYSGTACWWFAGCNRLSCDQIPSRDCDFLCAACFTSVGPLWRRAANDVWLAIEGSFLRVITPLPNAKLIVSNECGYHGKSRSHQTPMLQSTNPRMYVPTIRGQLRTIWTKPSLLLPSLGLATY